MARTRYVYHDEKLTGNVRCEVVSIPFSGTPTEATLPFQQTVMNAYAEVEAAGKFKSSYSKDTIKRVHETALARDQHQKGR